MTDKFFIIAEFLGDGSPPPDAVERLRDYLNSEFVANLLSYVQTEVPHLTLRSFSVDVDQVSGDGKGAIIISSNGSLK